MTKAEALQVAHELTAVGRTEIIKTSTGWHVWIWRPTDTIPTTIRNAADATRFRWVALR